MVEKKSGIFGKFWGWIAGIFGSERLRGMLRNAFIDNGSDYGSADLLSVKESKIRSIVEKEFSDKFHLIPKKSLRDNKSDNNFWVLILLLLFLSTVANVVLILFWDIIIYIIISLWVWIALGTGVGALIILILFFMEKVLGRNRKVLRAPLIIGGGSAVFATGWNFGLQEFSTKFLSTFKNVKIFVNRSPPDGLRPSARVYEWFSSRVLGALRGDISGASYKFRVSKRWLSKAGVGPESVSLFFRTPNSWKSSPAKNIGSDDESYLFESSGNFGIHAIGVKNSLLKKRVGLVKMFASTISKIVGSSLREISEMFSRIKSIVPWKELIVVLFIAAILFGTIILYRSEISKKPVVIAFDSGIPPQVWDKNSRQSLDLNKYFSDPDGEDLVFTHTETGSIDVDIVDGIAIFTPNRDFVGEEAIVFTATDSEGSSISSNIVILVVTEPSFAFFKIFTEWIAIYYKFIITGLALGTFIVVGAFLFLSGKSGYK